MQLAQWIKEARQGSSAAQKCLFDAFADRLLTLCCRYVKTQADAEELLLNGFFKFFTNLPNWQYESDAALYSYLKQVMVNECLMFLRKKKVFQMVAESAAADLSLEEDALDQLSAAEIYRLILQLPVGYRTVFNLFSVEGYSHEEIGQLLGISAGTSKSQLSKARGLLQKLMTQNGMEYGRKISR